MPLRKLLTRVSTAPKQPIKKLPESIEVPADATVEDVKHLIARQAGFSDFNRVGLFDPSTQKTLKNRKAQISSEDAVISAGQVLVKDLGTLLSNAQSQTEGVGKHIDETSELTPFSAQDPNWHGAPSS